MCDLSVDLKNMLNEMSELRKAFKLLKEYNESLVKLTEEQKQQLNKSRNRSKKLMDLVKERYRSVFKSKNALKEELNYLRTVVSDLQLQIDNHDKELASKEDLFVKLEDELEILRSQIDLQVDEHKKNIEIIQERNRIERNREISQYQAKLDAANVEIEKLKTQLEHQMKYEKNRPRYSHPALSDCESSSKKEKNSAKRNKKSDFRFPHLNITTLLKKEESPKPAEQSTKKKKLFVLDDENIIDLEAL